ncbi:unnamed protein product [Microthlaspi erraticum]|uniref:RING-type E3 ubiquitin transferase n=1 Tax=Microthlaspi erraticum TaxID=1685480 RepID=A0A6D2IPH6_9BRAS|nr:unnamed protein product [Microthlaspi erraticum]
MSIPPRKAAAFPGRLSVHRSPKRQRLTPADEDESDGFSVPSDEEEVDFSTFANDSSFSSDSDDDLLIARVVGVPRTATIANGSGNVTRSVNTSTPGASSSSSSSWPQSVKLKSSDVLDCPTCREPLKKPIYQCSSNGHLACSPCVTKRLNRCTFCRSHIGDIRCRAMEKIIETSIVPCRNSVYGCQETFTYGNKPSSHENLCGYMPCSCPLPGCNFIGSYSRLRYHARSSHSWGKENHVQFTLDRPIDFNLDLVDSSPAGTCNYSCSLARLDWRNSLRIGMMVKKIQKVDEQEEEPRDGFLFIPSYMFGDYANCCHLKLQICIGREDKYVHI